MFLKQFVTIIILSSFILAGCSGKNNRPVSDSISAFMNENNNIVSFGSIDYNSVLYKAEYKSIPKLGKIVGSEVDRLGNSINTKMPVYFALEGPFDSEGNPVAMYVFFDVKNQDSLVDRLSASGLFVEKKDELRYALNGDVAIGVKGNLAVLISKKEKYDGQSTLVDVFKKSKGSVSGDKINALLAHKGDIVMNVSMEKLYGTSNTDLSKLDETKQKEIQKMMNNSYLHSTLNFEKGKIILKTENIFSSELQKRMFFKEGKQSDVLKKLGKGKSLLGIALNIDVVKAESFLDDYAPDFKRKMINQRSESALAVMMLGDNPLTKVFSGMASMVVVGQPGIGSFIPDLNFNVGIGKEGKPLFEMWANQAGTDRFIYKVTDTDLIGSSPNAGAGMNKLIIPDCGKDFGTEGLTGFIDFEGLNVSSFGLPTAYKSLNLVKNITFKANNERIEFVINFMNSEQNVLKQVIDLYIKDIEGSINQLAI